MKCSICRSLFNCDNKNICYYCNHVICDNCGNKYIGTPKFRLFQLQQQTDIYITCFICYCNQKYKNYV